jgi:hypothetical protein
LGNSNYGQLSSQPIDLDEFYNVQQVGQLLTNRLSDSIDYNMKNITFVDYPQDIKDVINTKVDNQLLQSLITTTVTATSNLTQNDKLKGLDKTITITPNTPIKDDGSIKAGVEPDIQPVEKPVPDTVKPVKSGNNRTRRIGGLFGRGTFADASTTLNRGIFGKIRPK